MTASPAEPVHQHTLVSFHAHPDDEVLLTGGTLAKASASGHRVIIVVATDGGAGLTAPGFDTDLATGRLAELDRSAALLGCHRVVCLGFADSGMHGEHRGFAQVEIELAAQRLAQLLREEAADVLTTYDRAGGYGHPDHLKVHAVGDRAAEIAGTPIVLQATVDRARLVRVTKWLTRLRIMPRSGVPDGIEQSYSAPEAITHRIDVRPFAQQKRAAMGAHASQAVGGESVRTLALLCRLPLPLYRRVCGTEWFVQDGAGASGLSGDPFAGLVKAGR